MDKINARIGAWALEAGDPLLGTKRRHASTYPFLEGSPRWASFLVGWPTDRPLDKSSLMIFSHGFDTVGEDPDKKESTIPLKKGTILYLREE
jgi:hypothetical protein